MIGKYRSGVPFGGPTEQVSIGAEESKLILKALLDGEWKLDRFDTLANPFGASYQLGLTNKDGWAEPVVAPSPPGAPPDVAAVRKAAFAKWLAGPGKDYQIKKFVPKAAAEK